MVDTMASGQAIKYKHKQSSTSHVKAQAVTVSNRQNDVHILGNAAQDTFCIYDYHGDYLTKTHAKCAAQFDFVYFTNEVKSESLTFTSPVEGILDFGPVKREHLTASLLNGLQHMGLFNNPIISFDLNPVDSQRKSYITFNGANTTNVENGASGIVYKNSLVDDEWRFNFEEGSYLSRYSHGSRVGKRFDDKRSSVGGAVIATASPYIEIPFTDYNNLAGLMYG